ncbi:hypothetical protein ACHAXS_012157 [Conticribra weissflogii]
MKNRSLWRAPQVPSKASMAIESSIESTNSQQNLETETPSERTINIDSLYTNDDLLTLKNEDPFLYFSIPAIKKAEYLSQNVDISRLDKAAIRRNCSCPGRMETEEFSQVSRTVSRKSRISFECHSSLIMSSFHDEILNEKNRGEAQHLDDDIDILSLLDNL